MHLNEPGRTEWEGFYTGTRAAASGGVTTVVDMPLNSIPPTTTVENLESKRAVARGQCITDVAFWGGIIPNNQVCSAFPMYSCSSQLSTQSHLRPLIRAGVRGFKCFLIESGVDVRDVPTPVIYFFSLITVRNSHAYQSLMLARPWKKFKLGQTRFR